MRVVSSNNPETERLQTLQALNLCGPTSMSDLENRTRMQFRLQQILTDFALNHNFRSPFSWGQGVAGILIGLLITYSDQVNGESSPSASSNSA